MDVECPGSQGFETLSLDGNGLTNQACPNVPETPFGAAEQQAFAELEDAVPRARFGIASNPGGRPYQDDRCAAFSLVLKDGRRASVAAILDGHHGHQLSELIAAQLPLALMSAIQACSTMVEALEVAIRTLDDTAFEAHASGRLPTGGTTLLVAVLVGTEVTVANVGDCKIVLSSRGAPEALSEAHNPPVETERARFAAAGVPCFGDHIGGSDINVCRTIGDYDLGSPIKWREGGTARGPLIADPEISVRILESTDEFLVLATDGLWDYYTPESSVVTDARRQLRSCQEDPQACAEWLVGEAIQRQRCTLHEGTPGDNVTVMVVQVRPLPQIPRTSASRLNLLRRPASDAADEASQVTPPSQG